ncbi:DUF4389 domain-containing protein [Nocardia sp. CDC160]|uniref:DUF4389 domain-containing protein n=1 Tax=Nocardia sp. CDC160 TaxID=3112166 RepID=UPI002DBCA464|nr:DUF4389 domain-containing protein [Nocardia sp. CDC160]MEC3915561.1 DUF4389 domain-containing protein [Nocardia sp. CDC160]
MQPNPVYPVRVRGDLDPGLSRWMWIVKWILAIPHYIVLIFLSIAYLVVSIIAFFAILFTESYPRALFDFNVGVLRWSWRVRFYALSQLGTDRYPPFRLAPDPSYPADLEVDYPETLNRWMVLIKWWLLAIPQYLIVAAFMGGGRNMVSLLPILLIIAAIGLLFTGAYPPGLYDFAMGVNRWSLRVRAYASLMTDAYPPFRLDQGAREPDAAAS